jgi:hypothetical protein
MHSAVFTYCYAYSEDAANQRADPPSLLFEYACRNGYLKRQVEARDGTVVKRMKMEQQGQAGECSIEQVDVPECDSVVGPEEWHAACSGCLVCAEAYDDSPLVATLTSAHVVPKPCVSTS